MSKIATSTARIRFNDCDMFGHLNNSSYIDYLINAREDHLRDNYQLILSDYYKKGQAWVVGAHEIMYLRPALYNENVIIQTTLLHMDEYSLQMEAMMLNQDQTQLKAILRTRFIHVNTKTAQKEPHAPEFLEWGQSIVNTDVQAQGGLADRVKILQAGFKGVRKD